MKKKIFLLFVLCICSNFIFASNYYWVGGTGNWSDFGNHWATASGGNTFQTHTPFASDNVFFDGNSFIGSHDTVYANQTTIYCTNMTWSGFSSHPVFTSNGSTAFNIQGSLIFSPNLTYSYSGTINFQATTLGNIINCAGCKLRGPVVFNGLNAEWILQDSLSNTGYSTSFLYGTLRTNNHNIRTQSFTQSGTNPCSLYLGTSTVTLIANWTIGTSTIALDADSSIIRLINGTFTCTGPVSRFNYNIVKFYLGFATLNISNTNVKKVIGLTGTLTGANTFIDTLTNSGNYTLNGSGNNKFNYLQTNQDFTLSGTALTDTINSLWVARNAIIGNNNHLNVFGKVVVLGTLSITSDKNKFRFLSIAGNATFSGNHTLLDTLILTAGRSYIFASTDTTYINNWFAASGTPSQPVYLAASVVWSQSFFSIGQTNLCLDNLVLQDLQGIGTNLNLGANTNNVSNNSGWQFTNCISSCTLAIAPTVSAYGIGCNSQNNQYSISNATAGQNYFWLVTNGSVTSGQGTDSVTVLWNTNGSLQVLTSSVCGQVWSSSYAVSTLFTPSGVNFNFPNVNAVCLGVNMFFSCSGLSNVNYSWTITTGNINSGQGTNAITATFTSGDTAIVLITVSNACGVDTAMKKKIIMHAPTLSSSGNIYLCPGTPILDTITNFNSNLTYTWSGGTGTAQYHTFTQLGTYTALVQNNAGCFLTSAPLNIIGITQVPVVSPANSTLCYNEHSVFSTQFQPGTTYTWNVTGGNSIGVQGTAIDTVVWNSPGLGSVSVTVTNQCPTMTSTVSNIIIDSLAATPILSTSGNAYFCSGQIFIDTVINPCYGCAYFWSGGLGGNDTIHSFNLQNHYSVKSLNVCGFSPPSDSLNLINLNYAPTITTTGAVNLCQGNILLDSVINPCPTCFYSWSDSSVGAYDTITTAGTYYVIDSSFCGVSPASQSVTLNITALPITPVLNYSDTVTICPGLAFNDTVSNPCPGCIYHWSDLGIGQIHPLTVAGPYYVWTINSCGTSINNDTVVVINFPALNPIITLVIDTLVCNITGVSYQWFYNGVLITGSTHQKQAAHLNGNYTVNVYDNYGCIYTSPIFTVSNVGINQINDGYFSIFPNPATSSITITTTTPQQLTFYDLLGREIYTVKTATDKTVIEVTDFPAVFIVKTGEGKVRKVVKE